MQFPCSKTAKAEKQKTLDGKAAVCYTKYVPKRAKYKKKGTVKMDFADSKRGDDGPSRIRRAFLPFLTDRV